MNLARRLWVYQAERFPLLRHGLLVAALTVGGVGYASSGHVWPAAWVVVALFVVTLGSFLILRVMDEHKDAAADAAHRPYRPVPRGLVTLAELRLVAGGVALFQLVLTVLMDVRLLPYLLLVWLGMALLGREFLMGERLRAHPLLYMLSHMLVLPLLFVYLLAAARPAAVPLHGGLGWFLVAAYANGLVFEIGRKLRHPAAEEPGVETYSALWGVTRAAAAWATALIGAGVAAWAAAAAVGAGRPVAVLAIFGAAAALWSAWAMARTPSAAGSKRIELVGALWVLALYLALGVAGHF